ncbi:uncharacterized protein E5676_scaffold488G00050 [Cucumis melo var. makuwa]|uniref:Uncharacterized protein n=1 Tax=Cucumis melo var. makuwa TaxID=1194695 RepID=A0A5A7VEK3_CUCMM|nr:uncharacterized protein E6C27_scaffold37G00080 [Cucumis melo var. makuwa]TYK13749.1 uncharacterized protein E5676_scaffold488G00050 [Cucumis melo var. makuwa]
MSNMSMHSSFESKFDEPSDVLKWAEEMQQKFGDGINNSSQISVITGPSVDNITGINEITRSGRCYKPDNLTVPSNGLILEQGRKNEKRNVKEHCRDQDVEMPIIAKDIEYKKLVTDEEANEFLKIVKQSENKIIEQMHHTQARISLLSLFLNSEPHREVLLDILNKAHVGHDISVEKFSGIIGNITSSNSIVLTDDEIPPEGLGHTKALHIQVKCKDYVIARVLVDNRSTLNIMPKSTLLKLPVDMSHIKSSTMVVKAFDGSRSVTTQLFRTKLSGSERKSDASIWPSRILPASRRSTPRCTPT